MHARSQEFISTLGWAAAVLSIKYLISTFAVIRARLYRDQFVTPYDKPPTKLWLASVAPLRIMCVGPKGLGPDYLERVCHNNVQNETFFMVLGFAVALALKAPPTAAFGISAADLVKSFVYLRCVHTACMILGVPVVRTCAFALALFSHLFLGVAVLCEFM